MSCIVVIANLWEAIVCSQASQLQAATGADVFEQFQGVLCPAHSLHHCLQRHLHMHLQQALQISHRLQYCIRSGSKLYAIRKTILLTGSCTHSLTPYNVEARPDGLQHLLQDTGIKGAKLNFIGCSLLTALVSSHKILAKARSSTYISRSSRAATRAVR